MQSKLTSKRMVRCITAGMAMLTVLIGLKEPPLGRAQSQAGSATQQSATTQPLSFEVASIKPSQANPGMIMIGISSSGGRFTASGVTLKVLIQQAFEIKDYQIAGAPGWASSDRYDIVAKAENPKATSAEIKLMLQSLLAERFNLKFHRETKDLPIYHLVVAKNGPKLKKSEFQPGDTPPPDQSKPGTASTTDVVKTVGGGAAGGAGGPVIVKPAGGGAAGGVAVTAGGGGPGRQMMSMSPGHLNAQGAPVALLVQRLAQALGRPVVDKTGLTGNFDFSLTYAPEESERGMGIGGGQKGDILPAPPPGDSSAPSVFTAVQEQLGLKLEAAKGPVDLYVIDSVDRPSPD